MVTPEKSIDELAVKLDAALESAYVLEEDLAEKAEEVMRLTLELEAKHERYQFLFRLAPDAFLVTDLHGVIRDANAAATQLLNIDHEFVCGKPLTSYIHRLDREEFRYALNDFQRGSVRRDWQLRLIPRGQGEQIVSVTAALVSAAEGKFSVILWLIRDVTEQRRLQRQLAVRALELAVLAERTRMSRELHDTLAQGFTGILMQLQAAEDVLSPDQKEVAGHLSRAQDLARSSLNEARRAVHALRPAALEAGDLVASLRGMMQQVNGTGTGVTLELAGKVRVLPEQVEDNLLRICQEALTNSVRHGGAEHVHVSLLFEDRRVGLKVEDDGSGFDTEARTGQGMGLVAMEERVRVLRGDLELSSTPGSGTCISVTVPLEEG